MAAFCAGMLAFALSGYEPPAGPSIDVASPLKNGVFYVVNGGYSILINPHMKTLKQESLSAYRAQSFAVDIVRLDRFGRRADGWWPADLTRYYVFGEPVYAPCSGVVARTEDRLPDLTPPDHDRQHPAGKLRAAGVRRSLRAPGASHAVQRSGQTRASGSKTGNGSAVWGIRGCPWSRICTFTPSSATNAEDFLAAEPLPLRIDGQTPVRNRRFNSHSSEIQVPAAT